MGIQINGQTDTISATDGSFTISGASGNLTGNLTGDVTGNVTGNLTGNLTGTASTATAAATAYGLSGTPTLSGITSVSTSNLTVNGNAYPTAGPLSNRNLVINGAMQVAQRGTSSTISGYGAVDRFYWNFGGGLAGTQSQQTLSSGTPYDEGFRKFYRFAISTTASAANTTCQVVQIVEAQNVATSGWQYASADSDVTISFWVRSSVAQTFYGALIAEDGTAQNYVFSFATSSNTWTKVTKTIPGNSNITVNDDNGAGLKLIVYAFMGTDYSDSGVTVDAWQAYSGSTRVPDMTSTWVTTAGATFDLTGVQLEVGSVATPFEHRSYGDELRRCERYFQIIKAIQAMSGGASTIVTASINLRTVMRATPSWAQTGAFTFERSFYGGTTQTSASVSVYSAGSNTPYGAYLKFENIPPTLPDNVGYYLNDTDYLTASSEL